MWEGKLLFPPSTSQSGDFYEFASNRQMHPKSLIHYLYISSTNIHSFVNCICILPVLTKQNAVVSEKKAEFLLYHCM